MRHGVHPIEAESYVIIRGLLDLSHLSSLSRSVVERVVHASADTSYAHDLVLDEEALGRGQAALREGAPIVADVGMVASGITRREVRSFVADPRAVRLAAEEGRTRSATGIKVALDEVGPGAIWVVGCSPTALVALLEANAEPAFVVGLPVGFVGAVEAKAALRASGLPAVSNLGPKGGSAVAAAALNALITHEATS
ncbi:MAG: precorrin-8X methylmutase [Actinomycetota bacterium]|nr:precorrin-8X methylmutase [Actinomycetota bacterium]